MELVNTIIAILALGLSSLALIVSFRQNRNENQVRLRNELLEVIKEVQRFRRLNEEMQAERQKTGAELEEHELGLFKCVETIICLQDEMEKIIKKALKGKKINISGELHTQALVIKTETESLTHFVEFKHQQFLRFNQNRVKELNDKLEDIGAKLKRWEYLTKHSSGSPTAPAEF